MLPIYYHGNHYRYKEHNNNYLIEHILSYKTPFFNIVTTISYAFSSAIIKSLHATLVKICTSRFQSSSFVYVYTHSIKIYNSQRQSIPVQTFFSILSIPSVTNKSTQFTGLSFIKIFDADSYTT